MYQGNIRRGDILLVNLGYSKGTSVQRGTRPALVVQSNIGNLNGSTFVVVAFTSGNKSNHGLNLFIHADSQNGLACDSTLLLNQIKTVGREDIIKYYGTLTDESMLQVDTSLSSSLGLSDALRRGRVVSKVVSHIETTQDIKLFGYQRAMIREYLSGAALYVGKKMGKSLVLKGIADYFMSLDARNVLKEDADRVFDFGLICRDVKKHRLIMSRNHLVSSQARSKEFTTCDSKDT